MVDFVVDPGGDTIITLTNPNVALPPALAPEATPPPPSSRDKKESSAPVTFLVSSKQLMAASPVFNVMLTRWGEGKKTDRRFHISAEEWDSTAMLVFLKAIHGRSVPRRVTRGSSQFMSLCPLVKLALIVDYYDASRGCDWSWVRSWIKLWPSPTPCLPGWHLVWWIFATIVFRLEDEFRVATEVAIVEIAGDLKVGDCVPIPLSVIKAIGAKKEAILSQIAAELKVSSTNIVGVHQMLKVPAPKKWGSGPFDILSPVVRLGSKFPKRSIREVVAGLRSFVSYPNFNEIERALGVGWYRLAMDRFAAECATYDLETPENAAWHL
ncbi:hypothetical protein QBC39DRAFT_331273 [Podospora conica]|nr:hypothetical protein QBC39DRAFT_331273 [Schizothecium conicum]